MAAESCPCRIRRASAVAAWLLWALAAPAANDGEGGRDARVRLTFDVDVPRLYDDSAIRRWVATDLHRRLGLQDTDALAVDRARPLGDYLVVLLSQTAHGVPVLYRESRLFLNGDDEPVRLHGYHSPFPGTPAPRPRLSSVEAASLAGGRAHDTSSSRLVFWPSGTQVRLSYELEGEFPGAEERPAAPLERVYVDASTGQVLDRLPLRRQAVDRRIHDFALACLSSGIGQVVDRSTSELLIQSSPLVRSEIVNTGDRSAERLFEILGDFHSFLNLVLEMDSIDGDGASLVAILGVRYHEASRREQCVGNRFGAGWDDVARHLLLPVTALDFPEVVAHEAAHGLVNSGSGLIYADQSGALDEAISDAIGVTFAAWLRNGAPRDANVSLTMTPRDWQLHRPAGVMRDMRSPGSLLTAYGFPYPDHYEDYLPSGGVHVNSSIINQAFYLLAEGGSHPGRPGEGPVVQGIGAMRAARIFGAAAALILTSNSDFEGARDGFAEAAELLHGRGSQEWMAVHAAMDAVGVPGNSDSQAPESNGVLLCSLIAGIAALGAGSLVLRLRSGRSSEAHQVRSGDQLDRPPTVGVVPVLPSTSPPTPREEPLLGTLRPVEGSEAVPLPETLLGSREGMIIGRNIELCHVEVRHSAVSRRHVRLRVGRETILVEDLNSLEGTQLDGIVLKPFEPQPITSGQTLRIGGAAFRLERKVKFRFRP